MLLEDLSCQFFRLFNFFTIAIWDFSILLGGNSRRC
jgi:hypothetical protein